MTAREKTANAIFIPLLLAGAIYGGTKLFLRKLHEGAGYTFPPEVVRQWAYMDPTPGISSLPRFTPSHLAEWLSGEIGRMVRTPGLTSILNEDGFYALMSRDLAFQLVARDPGNGDRTLAFVAWHRQLKDIKEQFHFTAHDSTGQTQVGTIEGIEMIPVPLDVLTELRDAGYNVPPDSIIWLQVSFGPGGPVKSIDCTYESTNLTIHDLLELTDPDRRLATASPTTLPAGK